MIPTLLHIYGPFAIHSYGAFAASALLISMYMISRDQRFKGLLTQDQFFSLMSIAIVCGIAGARLLFVLTHWNLYAHFWEWFALWEGGLSVLGGIISLVCIMPLFIQKYKIPLLPLFDLVAVYAPLFQSIARLGCLMAGCCYGCPTTMSWAISIDGMYVHPTQLYSSILLFGIFIILYTFKYQWARRPGLLITRYLMLASAERFIIEFWRSNPQIIGIWFLHYLSIQQWIALALFCTAGVFFKIRRYYYEHA